MTDKEKRSSTRNSPDSLLVVYILRILKKYSAADKPLTAEDVVNRLKEAKIISPTEKAESMQKKVRRHLDTLHASYGDGCIKKIEGQKNQWYYDVLSDQYGGEEGINRETLSDVEIELLIDLISETKVLNSESTLAIVDKLLRKMSLPAEEVERRIEAIRKEAWAKNLNNELVWKKEDIQSCFGKCDVTFDYEGESIVAVPLKWDYDNGLCFLEARVGGTYRKFSLDKIRDFYPIDESDDICEDEYKETISNNTSLDYLFVNIPIIKSAIRERRSITFNYLTYVVKNGRVVFDQDCKKVLPHSLVFSDGKYYLISIDEDATDNDKTAYFRVDLMVDLECTESPMKLSEWNKQVYDRIERAREIEMHPLMQVGRVFEIRFLVLESALDRVRDAYGKTVKLKMTNKTKSVSNELLTQACQEHVEERLIEVSVKTTLEEAYRWALANADVVELISPQPIRNRLGRIAEPIYQTYTRTFDDQVRENIDYIEKKHVFHISDLVNENVAFATFKELKRCHNTEIVEQIHFSEQNSETPYYLAELTNTKDVRVYNSPQCKNLSWVSNFTKLNTLHVCGSQVDDVSWLKNIRGLKWLEISDSPICDLSMLRDHTDIHTLHLANVNISDISFIENYQHLDWLVLVDCPIKDYSPLFRITSYIRFLEIDKKTAEKIDLDKLREKHIGINIQIGSDIDCLDFLY